ncbi:hypothetical protein EI94DRAFT_497384 [Lactarius quietus]|nr:hypothetical protein EI94DRAFT_497384 [Lactarius quietus]
MHILCTNGTPIVDTLDHLPPLLPLFLDYHQYTDVIISDQDELGISHALRLRDRVRYIDLHLPPSILHKCLMLMDGTFPMLEHLSLSLAVDTISSLTLPKTFLAPNLCYLALEISLPKRLRLLSSTASRQTRTREHPSFWLLYPETLSGASSVPSPSRTAVHWIFHPHTPSQCGEGVVRQTGSSRDASQPETPNIPRC